MQFIVLLVLGGLTRIFPVIVARILTSFGLGLASFGAMTTLFGILKGQIESYMGHTFMGDAGALLSIAGVGQAVAIVLSAIAIRVAWLSTKISIKKLGV